MNKQSGQFGVGQLLAIGGSIIVAVIGGIFGQVNWANSKIETVKAEQSANVLTISQRVTAQETKVDNLQNDVKEIKSDIKELLKRVK